MAANTRRALCLLEALEDRHLLAVSTQLINGSTLRLLGDTAHEWVHIQQNDALNTLTVQAGIINPFVTTKPPETWEFTSSSIKRIVVELRGGNDNLTYSVDGNTYIHTKVVHIDMGAGNDSVFIDMGGQLVVPFGSANSEALMFEPPWPEPNPLSIEAPVNITVVGGNGNDTIDAVFGHIRSGLSFRAIGGAGNDSISTSIAGNVAANRTAVIYQDGGTGNDSLDFHMSDQGIGDLARVSLIQRGGLGNDTLNAHIQGLIQGTLLVNQFGGNGNDKIDTNILANWASRGTIRARALGDSGNDNLLMSIKRREMPPQFLVLEAPIPEMVVEGIVHGVSGRNRAWVTPNVKTFATTVMERSWDVGTILPIDPWPL
ncbi:MAG TPA: calcium-binding protein [Gemmatales bacterium]|nr:calcium-binding protein [Gemmatales bacterium]